MLIQRRQLIGTPSFDTFLHIFNATISLVALFLALYTIPQLPYAIFSTFMYFEILSYISELQYQKLLNNSKMQCQKCLLRYNPSKRIPCILECGHTLCLQCISDLKYCFICNKVISKHQTNFSLLQILNKDKRQIDKYVKICFVGSTNVGKTTLIDILKGQEFKTQRPSTIGYDFSFIDRNVGRYIIRFQLWDSAGQQKFKAISPIHYRNADIVVIVYDIKELPEQNRVSDWIQEVQKNCPKEVQILLIGNKIDLAEGKVCKPLEQNVWLAIQQQKIVHYELSCKSKIGIQNVWREFEKNVIKIKKVSNNIDRKQISNGYNAKRGSYRRVQKSCC